MVESLSTTGDHNEAIKEIGKALELDPFSRVINRNVGYISYEARKYDDAIAQLKRAIELFPDDSYGHKHLCDSYAAKGMYDDDAAQYLLSLKLDGEKPETIKEFEDAYRKAGWKGFWLEQLKNRLSQENVFL